MSYRGLCIAIVAGALAAACTHTERRTVVVPSPVDDSCTYYGYTPGTEAYRVCVDREAAARARGRMARTYARDRIVADSQDACVSYGLIRGSERYERCVQREINYRNPA
ncbi:MAG: hypothetical protein JSR47_02235 [Proteobacteria bacterium]|nr:hypothetical protein [Pseudomonadota bacterium]MBS0546285.1 hypothetical protein [Pseudomonadota bacterium]